MERFVSKAGKAGEKSKGEGGVEASEEAVDVARNWPRLEVSSAEFKGKLFFGPIASFTLPC